MSHLYKIKVLKEQPADDTRRWPQMSDCIDVLKDIGLTTWEIEGAVNGGVTRFLSDEQIVKFHHSRRARGACPRIKWSVVGEA